MTNYIRQCAICQRSKYDTFAYPGLFQPLKIPKIVWSIISMEFIDRLPKLKGKTTILVMVDRLTNYSHFLTISHLYIASSYMVQIFLDHVYRIHGIPENYISDKDLVSTSKIWQDIFTMQGMTLSTSTTYHPQIDDQTEISYKTVETFLGVSVVIVKRIRLVICYWQSDGTILPFIQLFK